MWCKAPSRPPLSSANVCGTVPRLSRGRGPPDYNEPGKRKGKTKDADKSRKEELEGEKIQTIADKKVCPLFVAVINATPKGEKRKYIENR